MLEALLSVTGLSLLFTTSSVSSSLNLLFFYLTWATLLLSHPPLRIVLIGTATIRILCFWVPTLLFLAFDSAVPSLSAPLKHQAVPGVPRTRRDLLQRARVAGVAGVNMAVGIALHGAVEYALTSSGRKSGLRVSTALPLPHEIVRDVARGLLLRELLAYYVHRYLLHGDGVVGRWHREWKHSVRAPWSAVAHYDHVVCEVLERWLPLYAPALFWRFHALTWFLVVAVASVEEAVTCGGYSVGWSLLGAATRRVDRHFEGGGVGNFSCWGVLDWVHGTAVGKGGKRVEKKEEVERRRREDTAD